MILDLDYGAVLIHAHRTRGNRMLPTTPNRLWSAVVAAVAGGAALVAGPGSNAGAAPPLLAGAGAPAGGAAEPQIVAAYGFDEGAGTTAADSSGNSLNGTVV